MKKNPYSCFPSFDVGKTGAFENIDFTDKAETQDKKSEYFAALEALNESTKNKITDLVKENPCCVLSYIFEDYMKDLENLGTETSTTNMKKIDNEEKNQLDDASGGTSKLDGEESSSPSPAQIVSQTTSETDSLR